MSRKRRTRTTLLPVITAISLLFALPVYAGGAVGTGNSGENASYGAVQRVSSGYTTRTLRGVQGAWVPTQMENILMFLKADGSYLMDGYTADGFYVNKYGFWAPAVKILDAWAPSRNSWLTADQMGDFEGVKGILTNAQKKLTADLHGYRVISLYNDHVTLSSIKSTSTEREKSTRLALYKSPDFNGYTIQVRTRLAGDGKELTEEAGEWSSMAEYDYQVLRLFMYLISRSGDKVAQAVYSSWEDTNSYGLKVNEWVEVGDTMVRYVPSQGFGLYEIRAAF